VTGAVDDRLIPDPPDPHPRLTQLAGELPLGQQPPAGLRAVATLVPMNAHADQRRGDPSDQALARWDSTVRPTEVSRPRRGPGRFEESHP
jgi:hypothetical protein